jgi:hypothetical protein
MVNAACFIYNNGTVPLFACLHRGFIRGIRGLARSMQRIHLLFDIYPKPLRKISRDNF